MRVLVVGSGGREHALAWKIARSPRVSRVLAAPGSDAIARGASCFPAVRSDDAAALVSLCRAERVDLVVIGPEAALAAGVSDRLRDAGFPVFGPSAAAARLEASKAFAKRFMARHEFPPPPSRCSTSCAAAQRHVRGARAGPAWSRPTASPRARASPCATAREDALAALDEMMAARRFGAAGERVVIEERLVGEEVSYYAVTDGETIASLAAAQDHKRALDGDRGENTGGMGACSPPPGFAAAVEKRVLEEIVHPTRARHGGGGLPLLRGALRRPDDRRGRHPAGGRVQRALRRSGDAAAGAAHGRRLVRLLEGAAHGRLGSAAPLGWSDAAVCVVLASGGYPRAFETGRPIEGLEAAERDPEVVVFHAGHAARRRRALRDRGRTRARRDGARRDARRGARARLRRRGSDPIRGQAPPARHRARAAGA